MKGCPHCGVRGWLFKEPGPGKQVWLVCINCGHETYVGAERVVEATNQKIQRGKRRGAISWDKS